MVCASTSMPAAPYRGPAYDIYSLFFLVGGQAVVLSRVLSDSVDGWKETKSTKVFSFATPRLSSLVETRG